MIAVAVEANHIRPALLDAGPGIVKVLADMLRDVADKWIVRIPEFLEPDPDLGQLLERGIGLGSPFVELLQTCRDGIALGVGGLMGDDSSFFLLLLPNVLQGLGNGVSILSRFLDGISTLLGLDLLECSGCSQIENFSSQILRKSLNSNT
jgi:hypothetical protein